MPRRGAWNGTLVPSLISFSVSYTKVKGDNGAPQFFVSATFKAKHQSYRDCRCWFCTGDVYSCILKLQLSFPESLWTLHHFSLTSFLRRQGEVVDEKTIISVCCAAFCCWCVREGWRACHSLSLESCIESGLTGVGSLHERLKLLARRSAKADGVGRRGRVGGQMRHSTAHAHTLQTPEITVPSSCPIVCSSPC